MKRLYMAYLMLTVACTSLALFCVNVFNESSRQSFLCEGTRDYMVKNEKGRYCVFKVIRQEGVTLEKVPGTCEEYSSPALVLCSLMDGGK